MPARGTGRTLPAVCLALALWTLAVYAPARHGRFLAYDDETYITRNDLVKEGLTLRGVEWAFGLDANTVYWHPLTWISHMIDVSLFGLRPEGHHWVTIGLHTLSMLLLFLVLFRATKALYASAVVAALFSLHPLHVESVAWLAERKDVLAGCFWMLTMGAYVLYVERPGALRYLAALLAFVLGLMSKPMLVTLPFVLLLLDYWPLGRFAAGARAWRRLVMEKIPFLGLAAASSVLTFFVQEKMGAVSDLPFRFRLGNAVVSYAAYLGQTFLPVRLAAFYPHPHRDLAWGKVLLAGALLVLISLLVLRLRRFRYATVGWSWYVVTLLPVIGLILAGDQARADRFTYVPLIGIFLIVVWGVRDLARGWSRAGRRALALATGLVLVVLSVLTVFQIRTWRDSITLFTHTLDITGENSFAQNNLATALSDAGRDEEAAVHYAEAVRLNPMWAEGHSNLGNVLVRLGRTDEAIAAFRTALEVKARTSGGREDEHTAVIHFNLGRALAEAGRPEEAAEEFREAIRIQPVFPQAEYSLGTQMERLGDWAGAAEHYRRAVEGEPRMIRARNNLAVALYQLGDYAGAWRVVGECRAQGFEPAAGFLTALSARMPEPGRE